MDTESTPDFPLDQLAAQITDLLMKGGNLGMLVDYSPQDYDVMYAVAHGHYAQGRYEDALKLFGHLAMMDPLERRFLNAYAACLQMVKRHEDALKFYGMVSAMDMTDPAPTFHLCECMIALGRTEDARAGLEVVIAQCPRAEHTTLRESARGLLALLARPAVAAA